jgi:GDP-D-mannose dehydratase
VNADWQQLVHIDKDLFRPTDIIMNKVDPSKAASSLGWTATFGMRDVVEKMLVQEVELIRSSNLAE